MGEPYDNPMRLTLSIGVALAPHEEITTYARAGKGRRACALGRESSPVSIRSACMVPRAPCVPPERPTCRSPANAPLAVTRAPALLYSARMTKRFTPRHQHARSAPPRHRRREGRRLGDRGVGGIGVVASVRRRRPMPSSPVRSRRAVHASPCARGCAHALRLRNAMKTAAVRAADRRQRHRSARGAGAAVVARLRAA